MGTEIADRVSFMNLKESTLYHLNACEKAKTKSSWNYHYAIYTWQNKIENSLMKILRKNYGRG